MNAEPVPGFYAAVREMLSLSDHVIYLSERERERLELIGARPKASTIVQNPVDYELFANSDPALFEEEFGLKNFIVCVARQETRKNQLMLLQALKGLDIPIVLIGHIASQHYRSLIERYAGPNVTFIERLAPNSPLLASAFAAARVAVLPSWAEGAPLAALEAAAAGASMVLSNESGEEEYFGDLARYADPASASSLRNAILEAYETRRMPEEVAAQQRFVADNFNWKRHVEATRTVYRATNKAAIKRYNEPLLGPELRELPRTKPISIVFDVTTSANHKGRWTGIARVEAALALALKEHPDVASIHFVAWNNKAQSFVNISFDAVTSGKTNTLLSFYDAAAPSALMLPRGAHYIVAGSGWMQNSSYVEGLVAFKNRHQLRLTPIIHDVIPVCFPFWFQDGYAPVFTRNLAMLLGNAEYIIAISKCTKRDIIDFAAGTANLYVPAIGVFREGDGMGMLEPQVKKSSVEERFRDTGFIVCVGAIHQRKNHKLLYDVWLKLAQRMGERCPKLIIVGGVAWNGEDLARALKNDARIKDYIFILDHIDDNGLAWLYTNCMFTVYPSLYEGWGLPVAESLRYGKLCIASNTSSVPEIAADFVELLDPLDPVAWLTKIQFYAGSRSAREKRERQVAEQYRPFSWSRSATEVVALLAEAETELPVPRPYAPGSIVRLSSCVESASYKYEGWHLAERWGSWSSQVTAVLEFELREGFDGPAVLVAEVQSLLFPGSPSETRVVINGVPAARWTISQGGLQVRTALIPQTQSNGNVRLRVEFHNANLIPAALVSKTEDKRSMGIGVGRVALVPARSVRNAQTYIDPAFSDPRHVWLGVEYNFLKQDGVRTCLQGDWSQNSAWGVFNLNRRPRLSFAVHEAVADNLFIEVTMRAVATEDNPISLIAMVNDVQCASWTFRDDQVQSIELPVAWAIRHRSDPLQIDLVPSDEHAPKTFGLSDLEKEFGFGLISMRVSSAGYRRPAALLPVPLGEKLVFSTNSPEAALVDLKGAWHGLEKDGIWSNGAHARLALQLPHGLTGNLVIWLEASVFERDGVAVPVQVCVNGLQLADITLNGGAPARTPVIVPEFVIRSKDWLELELTMPTAESPYKMKRGEDERLLGVRLRSLAVGKIPLLPWGTVVFFGTVRADRDNMLDASTYTQGDWYPAGRVGRWSRGLDGKIAIVSPDRTGGRLFLLARTVGATADRVVAVDIRLAGERIDSWFFRSDAVHLIEVRNFAEAAAGHFEILLELQVRNAQTPKALGFGNDGRLLGLSVRAMVLLAGVEDEDAAAASFLSKGLKFDSFLDRTYEMSELNLMPEGSPVVVAPPAAPLPGLVPQFEPRVSAHCRLVAVEHIDPLEFLRQSNLLDTSASGNALGLLGAGWYAPEIDGTWSEATGAQLRLPSIATSVGWIQLTILLRVYGTAFTGPAALLISTYGTLLARISLGEDVHHSITLALDLAAFEGKEPALSLVREGAVSPAQAGESDDSRMLGVFLLAVTIRVLPEAETDGVEHVFA